MVENDSARPRRRQHAVLAAEHPLHGLVLDEAEADDLRVPRGVGGTRPGPRAHGRQLLHLALTAVHHGHVVPGLHQIDGDGLPHHPQPHEPDTHPRLPLKVPRLVPDAIRKNAARSRHCRADGNPGIGALPRPLHHLRGRVKRGGRAPLAYFVGCATYAERKSIRQNCRSCNAHQTSPGLHCRASLVCVSTRKGCRERTSP